MLLVTERFIALAKAVRAGKGMPNQPSLYIPGNPEFCGDAELAAIVDGLIEHFVALVAPAVRSVPGQRVRA